MMSHGIKWNHMENLDLESITIINTLLFLLALIFLLALFLMLSLHTTISTASLIFTPNLHINSPQTRNMNPSIDYLGTPTMQAAKQRIASPLGGRSYEHHVGTWMGTLLKNVFQGEPWALTPERKDDNTNKKPDFVVEKLCQNQLIPHLIVEIKKKEEEEEEIDLKRLCFKP